MSLATRCTACGTIFRVVQDQLRVSEGWVRCGRCAEVFDAREQLFDIDREAPPPWPANATEELIQSDPEPFVPSRSYEEPQPPPPPPLPPPPPPPPPAPVAQPEPPPPVFEIEPEPARPSQFGADSRFGESRFNDSRLNSRLEPQWVDEPVAAPVSAAASAGSPAPERIEPPAISMGAGPDVVLAPGLAAAGKAAATAAPAPAPAAPAPVSSPPAPAAAPAAAMPIPEFMRRAENGERWRKPGVRAALAACVAVLLVVLGLQLAHQFHDAIVALHPQSRPLMQALCDTTGCALKPWQRIDAVSVEASALNQAGPNNQYQLMVSLRNKSGVEVATPWIELSLTDAAGTLVTRRMLAPTDFKASKAAMPAGSELPLQVLLGTGAQRVSGYTVEIFHP